MLDTQRERERKKKKKKDVCANKLYWPNLASPCSLKYCYFFINLRYPLYIALPKHKTGMAALVAGPP